MPQAGDTDSRSCGSVRERLAEYEEGMLTPWRRRQVARHVARCAGCAAELAALRRAVGLVQALPEERAPADLWDRVAGAIGSVERRPLPRTSPLRRLAVAGAVGLAAASLGLGIHFGRSADAPVAGADTFVRSHLALSQAHPFAPAAGLDALVLAKAQAPR